MIARLYRDICELLADLDTFGEVPQKAELLNLKALIDGIERLDLL